MLMIIMHNDEDYLKRIMSIFKERKAIARARIIRKKDLALSIGQTGYIFGGGLPTPLSEEYGHALVTMVRGKKKADALIKILEESLETIALSDEGLVVNLPLNSIEDLAESGRQKSKREKAKQRGL